MTHYKFAYFLGINIEYKFNEFDPTMVLSGFSHDYKIFIFMKN